MKGKWSFPRSGLALVTTVLEQILPHCWFSPVAWVLTGGYSSDLTKVVEVHVTTALACRTLAGGVAAPIGATQTGPTDAVAALSNFVFEDRHGSAFRTVVRSYQLDFVTPGIIPAAASSRKVMREILNRRMNARRRPVTWQRLISLVGLASRGSCERDE